MSTFGRDATTGSKWLRDPSLNLGTSGPARVDTSADNPKPKLPLLGFTSRDEFDKSIEETDPLLWEGNSD